MPTLTLFEASDRLGGVIHTERADGFLIDHGADMFSTNPPAAIELVPPARCRESLDRTADGGPGSPDRSRDRAVAASGGIRPDAGHAAVADVDHAAAFPSRQASFLGRTMDPSIEPTRLVQESRCVALPPDESVSDFRSPDAWDRKSSIASSHPFQPGFTPLTSTKLSMQATMGPIAKMERDYGSLARATAARRRSGLDSVERSSAGARYSQFRAFQGGMIELISTLAHALPAEHDPTAIALSNRSPIGRRGWSTCRNDSQEFDQVVLAFHPCAASRLLEPHAPVAAKNWRKSNPPRWRLSCSVFAELRSKATSTPLASSSR